MATYTKVGKRWRARVRRKGFEPISENFDTKAKAIEWATATESNMRAGKHKDPGMIADLTLGAMIDRYIKELTIKKSFGKTKSQVLEFLKKSHGAKLVRHITSEEIIAHVKRRLTNGGSDGDGVTGVTVGIELSYWRGVYKVAKDVWRLPVDPDIFDAAKAYMSYLDISTKSQERDRRVTEDEIKKLKQHFRDKGTRQRVPMWHIIDFAVYTSMRDAEITRICWEDVDHKHRTVIIRDRKHPTLKLGNHQTVPLLKPAWDIINAQPHREGRIFPYNAGTISTIFTRAVEELALGDLHFHDLRHEAISQLFEMGYRIEEVAVFSGHRDWKQLKRYTHIKAKNLHRDWFRPVMPFVHGDAESP